ncbi:hypothetical protein V1291_004744 [Nitrobacteraceae bacterium AZCC 1564]
MPARTGTSPDRASEAAISCVDEIINLRSSSDRHLDHARLFALFDDFDSNPGSVIGCEKDDDLSDVVRSAKTSECEDVGVPRRRSAKASERSAVHRCGFQRCSEHWRVMSVKVVRGTTRACICRMSAISASAACAQPPRSLGEASIQPCRFLFDTPPITSVVFRMARAGLTSPIWCNPIVRYFRPPMIPSPGVCFSRDFSRFFRKPSSVWSFRSSLRDALHYEANFGFSTRVA